MSTDEESVRRGSTASYFLLRKCVESLNVSLETSKFYCLLSVCRSYFPHYFSIDWPAAAFRCAGIC